MPRPEATPWVPGEALHTGTGRETPAELDGRCPGSLRPGQVPPKTPRTDKTRPAWQGNHLLPEIPHGRTGWIH